MNIKLLPLNASLLLLFSSTISGVTWAQAASSDSSTDKSTVKPQKTESIIISASPFERELLDLMQPSSIIDKDALRRNRASSLGDTLSSEPGVHSSSFGSGASRPIIRGQDGARVRVLQNGLGAMDVSTLSPDHAVTIETLEADQVEILLGPATLLYGSGAIGGVVNVTTDHIPKRLPPKSVTGVVDVSVQSGNRETVGFAKLDGGVSTDNNSGFAWHADVFSKDSEDIKIPGVARLSNDDSPRNKLPGSDARTKGGGIAGSYVATGKGFAGIGIHRTESNYGIPTEEGVRIDLKQTRVDATSEWNNPFAGASKLKFRAGINDYKHVELEPTGEQGTLFKNKANEIRAELRLLPIAGFTTAIGAQSQRREFSAVGEESIIPLTKSRENGLFVVTEKPFGPITAEFGLRSERASHKPDIVSELPNRKFNLNTISAGALWRVTPSQRVNLSLTRSERAPSIEELFSNGAHPATQTFDIGDPNLNKESANSFDIGYRGSAGAFRWILALFQNRYRNYVYQSAVDTDSNGEADRVDEEGLIVEDGEFLVQQATQRKATFRGMEASIAFDLSEHLSLKLFTDHVRARVNGPEGTTENLPRISPSRIGTSLQFNQGPWSGSVNLISVAAAKRLAALETNTKGYTKLDTEATYTLTNAFGSQSKLLFYAKGTNLLNRDIRLHTSYLKDVSPQMGRSFSLGLRAEF